MDHTRAVAVADGFALGELRGDPTAVAGGLLNLLWRFDTTAGSYAVKELNRQWDRPDWVSIYDRAFAFEQQVRASGVPAPAPIPNAATGGPLLETDVDGEEHPRTFLAHEWITARPITAIPVPRAFAARVGGCLARIHTVGTGMSDAAPGDLYQVPAAADVGELVADARAAGLEHADAVAALPRWCERFARMIDDAVDRDLHAVLSHRDIGGKNLLVDVNGSPILLDWEATGPIAAELELAQLALELAGAEEGEPDPVVVLAVLAGYRADAGAYGVREPGAWVLTNWLASWIPWFMFNVERCLGRRVQSAESVAIAEREVARGAEFIPRALDRADAWAVLLRR